MMHLQIPANCGQTASATYWQLTETYQCHI